MKYENYENAAKYILARADAKDFIQYTVDVVKENDSDDFDFRKWVNLYIEKLPTLNLSRLESFIIINKIRELLENEDGSHSAPIDSFLDDIYTRHTGDYPITEVLKFRNEPEDWKELSDFIHSEAWLQDTSWSKHVKPK
ncbi:MAG: hypothetical protein EOO07_38285 [Chitinophagaceae bacterium]|nr:MAG: hypothetical protein EOO07_38285 [Chitinophagaceae bacterium]